MTGITMLIIVIIYSLMIGIVYIERTRPLILIIPLVSGHLLIVTYLLLSIRTTNYFAEQCIKNNIQIDKQYDSIVNDVKVNMYTKSLKEEK